MADELQVAYFQADVTPPLHSPLCAGMSTPARQIVEPLTARGVVIHSGRARPVVLCAVDWVGIANESHIAWREAIAEAAGTHADNVALHCVHQHAAPFGDMSAARLLDMHETNERAFDSTFENEAISHTAAAITRSLPGARRITHVGIGQADVKSVASNRRILSGDGKSKAIRHAICQDEKIRDAPEGVIDPAVRLITLFDGEQPIVAMSFYACHAQSQPGLGEVTTGFVGTARSIRESRLPDVHHIHFCGAAGNITVGKYNDNTPDITITLAHRLERGITEASENTERHLLDARQIQWRSIPMNLSPAAHLNEEQLLAKLADNKANLAEHAAAARDLAWLSRCSRRAPVYLTVLALGPALIVGMPGEPFVEYQLLASAIRPRAMVCLAGYADMGMRHLCTRVSHAQGGYEPARCGTTPDAERQVQSAMAKLMNERAF